jgi:thiamine-phosphate pyrophosphorylase
LDPRLRVLLITPENIDPVRLESATESALQGGVRAVQLRDKVSSGAVLFKKAKRLRALTKSFDAMLFINGRVDVAIACGADGAHLGVREIPPAAARAIAGPDFEIGFSAHAPAETATGLDADWITYSPVYASPGKGAPFGVEGLAAAVRPARTPVIALGGIGPGEVLPALQAGAQGVAVIRSVYDAVNVQDAAASMVAAVQEWYGAKNSR